MQLKVSFVIEFTFNKTYLGAASNWIIGEAKGNIFNIRYNRPDKKNAMTREVFYNWFSFFEPFRCTNSLLSYCGHRQKMNQLV